MYTQRFTVDYSYPVWFTRGSFSPASDLLTRALCRVEPDARHRALVVIDAGVVAARSSLPLEVQQYADRHARSIELATEPVVVAGGEEAKNSDGPVRDLLARMRTHRIDRHAFVIMIGGGALLDMAGLAATLCHRGVRTVRMPTTTLAQNDAGIGVKNGINAFGSKNFIGTFAPPFAVINDFDFLDTLSERDRLAGIAEAVKVALIRDAALFDWLCEHARALRALDPVATAHMVEQGALLHLKHIAEGGDPFETGSARPLDYGHWAAHKLELMTNHELRHGEAVAIGLALDSRYGMETGLLDAASQERIQSLLTALGLPTWHPALDRMDDNGELEVLQGLRDFQEHLGGSLTVTMLDRIGHGIDVHEIDRAAMVRSIAYLRSRQSCV